MIRGFRWLRTGGDYWHLEGPAKTRKFHAGCYSTCDPDCWAWWADGQYQGEAPTRRLAMDAAEHMVRKLLETDPRFKTWSTTL